MLSCVGDIKCVSAKKLVLLLRAKVFSLLLLFGKKMIERTSQQGLSIYDFPSFLCDMSRFRVSLLAIYLLRLNFDIFAPRFEFQKEKASRHGVR